MATSATLTDTCPTCGQDVTVTVELALAPLTVEGKRTVIATSGMSSAAHFCPAEDTPPGE